jgi:hypothetical protein
MSFQIVLITVSVLPASLSSSNSPIQNRGVSPLSSATCTFSATISSLSPYRLLRSECLGVLEGMPDIKSEVIVCVPYPYLCQVETLTIHSQLKMGAQNLNVNASGAFTGEVSSDMLKDFGLVRKQ